MSRRQFVHDASFVDALQALPDFREAGTRADELLIQLSDWLNEFVVTGDIDSSDVLTFDHTGTFSFGSDVNVDGDVTADGLTIDGDSNFNGVLTANDGSSSIPAFGFESDPDTGVYLSATGDLRVTVAGTDRFKINTVTAYIAGTGYVEFDSNIVVSRTDAQLNAGTGGNFVRLYMDTNTGRLVRRSTAGA